MGLLNKPLWAFLGLMALGLAVSVSSALYFRGEAKTLGSELNAAQRDLKGLEIEVNAIRSQQREKARVDASQSTKRAVQAKAVRAVRAEVMKETGNANDSHVAGPAELDRLRRLVEAGNDGIRAARELP